MGACRENASLWYWLFLEGKHYSRRPLKGLLKNPYFWSDSFGRYIYKYLICKILGHRKAQWIDDDNGKDVRICFSCMSRLEYRDSKYQPPDYSNFKVPPQGI